MRSPSPVRRRAAYAALVAVIIVFKLLYLERWLVDNDNYITLSTFFSSAGRDDFTRTARRFYKAKVAACAPNDARCIAYSAALLGEQTYSRPITSFFGGLLVDREALATAPAFLAAITRVTVGHVLVAAIVVSVIVLLLLIDLPPPVGVWIAATSALFGVLAFWLPDETPWGRFQPLLGLTPDSALALLALLAVGGALLAWLAGSRCERWLRGLSPRKVWLMAAVLFAARVMAYRFPDLYFGVPVAGAGVGLLIVVLAIAGFALFVMALLAAGHAAAVPRATLLVAALLLFAFVSTGESFFTTMFHIAARGYIYLVAAPLLVYTALRPDGRAIWLLPLLLLFHISVAGVFYACLVATETVAAIRTRRFTWTPPMALVLLVIAGVHTVITGGNLVVTGSVASTGIVLARVTIADLLPGLLIMGVLGVAAAVAWRMPEPRGGLFLRAVMLAAILAGAGQLRHALSSAGFDIMDPGAYNYILLSTYLAPAVCAAGLFLVMLGVALPLTAPGGRTVVVAARPFWLLTGALLALAAARAGNYVGRPANPFTGIARGVVLAVGQGVPPTLDPRILEAAAPTDAYVVGPGAADAITMMSVLKMKTRAAAGVLDEARVTVVPPAVAE